MLVIIQRPCRRRILDTVLFCPGGPEPGLTVQNGRAEQTHQASPLSEIPEAYPLRARPRPRHIVHVDAWRRDSRVATKGVAQIVAQRVGLVRTRWR